MRKDNFKGDPVLRLNPSDQNRKRGSSPEPNTELGQFTPYSILVDKNERTVNVWISDIDLSSLKDIGSHPRHQRPSSHLHHIFERIPSRYFLGAVRVADGF